MGTRTAAVVPAAGRGTRFGSPHNKIWADLGGRTVLSWTLSALHSHPEIDAIVLVGAVEELDRLRDEAAGLGKVAAVVAGGSTRQESVGNGLMALPEACELVLVHDAARPAVSPALITRVIEATRRVGAAVPGLPLSDTIKRADPEGTILETVPREGLYAVQTPQGARLESLRAAYTALGNRVANMTDEAGILESAGFPVAIVPGEETNIKITRSGDLDRLGGHPSPNSSPSQGEGSSTPSLRRRGLGEVRTGFGYDVHPFVEGRPLWLGGVQIPHARGLAGHSDADALLHAVCDALLGAAGMGDIGALFPDTDAAHKDRPSIEFVREVRARLESAGYRIINVDVALLAEEPRIGPYRDQIAAVIADGLRIAPTQVNIKATTSERMGFVGRREGIACWAVATIAV